MLNMNFNKRKKKILAALAFGTVTVLGSSLAYFTSTGSIDNTFKTGKYEHRIEETFISPSDWLPGETIPKMITVTNDGSVDMAIRASFTESWQSKNGDELPLKQDGNDVAVIDFDSSWTKDSDGYYYYGEKSNMQVLAPGETSTSFINGVTFNENVTFNLNKTVSNDGKTITFTSNGNGYDDATYTLTVSIDTIQYSEAPSIWA